jgi:hypothetical protein
MRCSENATISNGPDTADSVIDPFRIHLKNRILVQDSIFASRLRRDTGGGAELSSVAGLSVWSLIFVGRKPQVRLRRIEGFKARHQQRYWAKRHF